MEHTYQAWTKHQKSLFCMLETKQSFKYSEALPSWSLYDSRGERYRTHVYVTGTPVRCQDSENNRFEQQSKDKEQDKRRLISEQTGQRRPLVEMLSGHISE